MVLEKEKHRLDMLSHRLESMNPELLLKRGYSITIHVGKIVTHASQLVPGQTIVTRLQDGEVTSKVVEAE